MAKRRLPELTVEEPGLAKNTLETAPERIGAVEALRGTRVDPRCLRPTPSSTACEACANCIAQRRLTIVCPSVILTTSR